MARRPASRLLRAVVGHRKLVLCGVVLGLTSFGFFTAVDRVTAGSQPSPAAVERASVPQDALPAAVAHRLTVMGYDTSSSRKIASTVYLVRRPGNLLCFVSIGMPITIGCQHAENFFSDNPVVFGVLELGSPPSPQQMRIVGVARSDVATIRVSANGNLLMAKPTADGGFAIDLPAGASQSRAGTSTTRPGTLAASNEAGKQLATYALPAG